MAKTTKTPKPKLVAADRRSGDVVVEHVAGTEPGSGTPARDLTGTDLARIVYVRRWNATDRDIGVRRPTPRPATPDDIAKLAAELVATGNFRPAKAAAPAKPAKAAAPAEPATTPAVIAPPDPPDQPDDGDATPDSATPSASEGE